MRMRKFITFLVVLIIQIAIIYGLYRWYVHYDTNSLNAIKDSEVHAAAQKENDTVVTQNNIANQQHVISKQNAPPRRRIKLLMMLKIT